MTISDFITQFILPHENAYGKDSNGRLVVVTEHVPSDPGGTTKFGIDAASHPHVDIENLTQEQAVDIYLSEYNQVGWVIQNSFGSALQDFPYPANLIFFDCRENCGLSIAWKCVQNALGLDADGIPGPNTKAAVVKAPPLTFAMACIDERIGYHKRVAAAHPQLAKFLDGWLNRCNDLKALQYFKS